MSLRQWPWALFQHAMLVQLIAYIVRPTAAYRALELGVPLTWLGLVASSFAVLPLFIAVFVGRIADVRGERLVLILGAMLFAIAAAGLVFWTPTLTLLLAWNVLLGLGHLLSVVGQQSRVAKSDDKRLDAAFGYYTVAGTIGQAAGPGVIAIVGGSSILPPTSTLFLIAFIAAVLLLVPTGFLARREPNGTLAAPAPSGSLRAALRAPKATRRRMIGAMLVSMMVLAAVDLLSVYLPALGVERQIPASVIGILLMVRAIATIVSRFFLGPLAARFGRDRLIVGSTAVSAVAVTMLTLPLNVWFLGAALVLAGVSLGIGQPLTMSVIALTAPPGTRGTWLALRLSANRFGQSAVPAVVGLVAASWGVPGVFAATAAGLAVVAVTSGRMNRRPK
ncbi:Major Facilitator Superfamily protein [Cryobacterium flavum]|uniref:MFS transporter n=1 Tax=Cryobacterium flavum TaxID=1424659 RepID=A0A4R8VIV0_9MICO|nr:MFS transporter [Cryobacterium flavum]TFB82312.1 MFS transporter [Cryobacterium flavum]SDN96730.1 Major Facilitator Superfamily protein [Cryobacterium flavum]